MNKNCEYPRNNLKKNVRWNMLASLGFGLWLALCITDSPSAEKQFRTFKFSKHFEEEKNDGYMKWMLFDFSPGICSILTMLIGIFIFIRIQVINQRAHCPTCEIFELNTDREKLFLQFFNKSPEFSERNNLGSEMNNPCRVLDSIDFFPRPDIDSINFHQTCGETSKSLIKSCNDSPKFSKKLGKFTLNDKHPCPKIDNKQIISSSPAFKMFLSRYQTTNSVD